MASSPFDSLLELFRRMGLRQRVTLGLLAVLSAGAIWGVTALSTRVGYDVLFANLEPDDASAVVAKLQSAKIPYRLEAGGSAISIPADRVAETRLTLASDGLPRGGGIGFEIFDRSSFDVSDFVQTVNYQRAMERELARTIEGLDAVSKARVHLVLPERTLFADQDGTEAKASVVVRLRRGRELRGDETLAVAHLIASGVRGLDPDKVSIVDTEGRMLRDGQGEASLQTLTARQLEVKANYERETQSKLVALLTPIVGEGRVRARVSATLDFTRVERVEEKYDPDGAVVRSEQKGRQARRSGSGGGAPGTAANLATVPPVASEPGSDAEESQDSTVNFEVPKTVATITEPVGEVEHMSVAVVVDNAPRAAAAETAGEKAGDAPASVPRTDEEMKKLTELVRAAIGLDPTRGDVLTVANLPFDSGPVEEQKRALGSAEKRDFWLQVAKWPSAVIGALLVFFLLLRPAARGVRAALAPAPRVFALPAGDGPDTPALALRRRLIEASRAEPEGTAHVVRGWLAERN